MKTLFYIFIALCWYGILTIQLGAAVISLLVAVFVLYCGKVIAADEAHPDNAATPPDAAVLLDKAGVECSDPTFRA